MVNQVQLKPTRMVTPPKLATPPVESRRPADEHPRMSYERDLILTARLFAHGACPRGFSDGWRHTSGSKSWPSTTCPSYYPKIWMPSKKQPRHL